MKCLWLGWLVFGGMLGAGALSAGTQDSEFNVNNAYTVETVLVNGDGWTTNVAADRGEKISSPLRKDIVAIIGEKLNPATLDDLARRLRKEFHARAVEHHILRGTVPDCVQVVFDVQVRPTRFDVAVPKFLYQAKQGWSGAVEGTAIVRHNSVTVGLVSDGDELAERYAGITARYQNSHLGSDRVHFGLEYGAFHEQWNAGTVEALPPQRTEMGSMASSVTSDVYRTRQFFEPVATFQVWRPLHLSLGASFESLQDQYPVAHTESANAAVASLRYHQRTEGSDLLQDFDAGYDLRLASGAMHSDLIYARHRWEFRYTLTHGKQVLIEDATAGMIAGQAPLFERFVLGNSSTLRGWNKFALDPLGGNRMVHNTVEYRYGAFQIFYDTGAIWDGGQAVEDRNSAGIGLRQGAFSASVAFPLREGHIDPIFMIGMNY
jgi:hypothetical protein